MAVGSRQQVLIAGALLVTLACISFTWKADLLGGMLAPRGDPADGDVDSRPVVRLPREDDLPKVKPLPLLPVEVPSWAEGSRVSTVTLLRGTCAQGLCQRGADCVDMCVTESPGGVRWRDRHRPTAEGKRRDPAAEGSDDIVECAMPAFRCVCREDVHAGALCELFRAAPCGTSAMDCSDKHTSGCVDLPVTAVEEAEEEEEARRSSRARSVAGLLGGGGRQQPLRRVAAAPAPLQYARAGVDYVSSSMGVQAAQAQARRDMWLGFECKCRGQYAGTRCNRRFTDADWLEWAPAPPRAADEGSVCATTGGGPCLHGGTCVDVAFDVDPDGVLCACPPGWGGAWCEEPVCGPDMCGGEGTCVAADPVPRCECSAGFEGVHCERSTDRPPSCAEVAGGCEHAGTCDAATGVCACPAGRAGNLCQFKDRCPTAAAAGLHCHMGSTCINELVLRSEGQERPRVPIDTRAACQCLPGYSSRHCTHDDVCLPNPCSHGGRCVRPSIHRRHFYCECPLGWTGLLCDARDAGVPARALPGAWAYHVALDGVHGLNAPDGITLLRGAQVLIANERGGSVVWGHLDRRRAQVLVDGLGAPEEVCVDPLDGSLFVSDDDKRVVLRFAAVPSLDGWHTAPEVAWSAADGLDSPEGIAVDRHGALWISDEHTRAVYRALPGTRELVKVAGESEGVLAPEGMAVGPDGTVFLTDDDAGGVLAISPDGHIGWAVPKLLLRVPEGICVAPAAAAGDGSDADDDADLPRPYQDLWITNNYDAFESREPSKPTVERWRVMRDADGEWVRRLMEVVEMDLAVGSLAGIACLDDGRLAVALHYRDAEHTRVSQIRVLSRRPRK